MEIKRIGSQPSGKGPADWFTGTVRIDPLFQAPDPALVGGASVTFEPGARTAWHTHPLGQTLIVTAGCGWVQREGGAIEEVHPGDVVWFSPGEKHWHGATPTTAWLTLPFRSDPTARPWTGWSTSATSNTGDESGFELTVTRDQTAGKGSTMKIKLKFVA
jgi:quercetin dioxygenase-like cupin family protein